MLSDILRWMTCAQAWNVAGIVLATLGVIGLFFFGAPFRVRGRGRNLIFNTDTADRNPQEERRDRLFDVLGWISLVVALAGAVCQVVGALD